MRIIRFPRLGPEKGINYSRQQLRRKIAAGEFPAPIPLNNTATKPTIGWLESEIDGWITERAALRAAPKAAA
jgi:predicted DNA-binding transcriptional regulator AlpA